MVKYFTPAPVVSEVPEVEAPAPSPPFQKTKIAPRFQRLATRESRESQSVARRTRESCGEESDEPSSGWSMLPCSLGAATVAVTLTGIGVALMSLLLSTSPEELTVVGSAPAQS